VSAFTTWTSGAASQVLVPGGGQYFMSIGERGGFMFTVAPGGAVSIAGGGTAATTAGNTLQFNNTTIRIDPGAYTGPWQLQPIPSPVFGALTVTLVPNTRYLLVANNAAQEFSVANPCAVDPPVVSLGGISFAISCGALDTDTDGVPDAVDNCPAAANPDQLNLDGDLEGDVCDVDRDGDTISNVADNCPAFPNVFQEDLDDDGTGDACDDDRDGDSVVDTVDVCPLVRNPDQADSDADLIGDACDPDNDNDFIANALDNCPLIVNPSQVDFDGDGQGDACDHDVDNDQVPNATDVCALTPRDQLVNAQGCSAAQFIARSCVVTSFVQHGQYVSCVADAANAAERQGLIRASDKARFVSDAATKKK
jgi:hypothetical protein